MIQRPSGEEVLLDALLGGDTSAAIERQEARGQAAMVRSDRLPVAGTTVTRIYEPFGPAAADAPEWAALGFRLGPADTSDLGTNGRPLFRPVTLPPGWARQGSDHSMWSYIVDERGRQRVAVFYKAAFYDRSAHCNLVALGGPCGKAYADHEFVPSDRDPAYCAFRVAAPGGAGREVECYVKADHRWHHAEADCDGDTVRVAGQP